MARPGALSEEESQPAVACRGDKCGRAGGVHGAEGFLLSARGRWEMREGKRKYDGTVQAVLGQQSP